MEKRCRVNSNRNGMNMQIIYTPMNVCRGLVGTGVVEKRGRRTGDAVLLNGLLDLDSK